jgi:hypothetical protein
MMQLWDQQLGESPQAFGAFVCFRDLGPRRTIDAAYRQAHPRRKAGARASGPWRGWAKLHRWAERAAAFDARDAATAQAVHDHIIADVAADRAAQIIEFQRTEFDLARRLGEVAMEMLGVGLVKQKVVDGENGATIIYEPAKWTFDTLGRLAVIFSQLSRLNLSMPTKVETAEAGQDAPLFDSSGEIEAAMPPGAMPAMPADTFVKPDLGIAATGGAESALKQPAHPPRPPAKTPNIS